MPWSARRPVAYRQYTVYHGECFVDFWGHRSTRVPPPLVLRTTGPVRRVNDELQFGGGHIDTPLPDGTTHRPHRPSDPIDTPYPTDGIAARPTVPHYPLPRYWRLRQRTNPYFMGRESLMAAIHNTFQAHPLVHLTGPPGSGATQTALAYAFRARPNFDAIFWIDGKDATIARFDMARAGARLDEHWQDETDLGSQLETVKHWMKSHLRWLLIVDGATGPEIYRDFLPDPPTGRVLITGHVPLAGVKVLEHPPFSHQQASLFLAHRSQQDRDENTSALARLLGYATMPIFLAGAYCHVTGTPVAEFRERIATALAPNGTAAPDTQLEQTVRALVAQALKYASENDPAALEMMALCAFFDTEDITLAMLCDGAPFLPKRLAACVSHPAQLNATLTLLYRLGLVQFEQNSLAIHPEVQAATRALLGEEQAFAWLMTALRVVREAFPVESRYNHPIPACSILLRHVFAVTARSELSNHLREGTGLLLSHVGLYLHACRELAAACACFERSIRLAESFHGPVHPAVAARVNSLGVILQDMKRYPDARACYERAFKICEAVYGPARDAALGPAHRSMLTMPSRNLCQVLELMGDVPGAKAAYQHAVNVFIEVYCWNHSLVAEAMNGLGQLFQKEKNLAVAKKYFEKAIQAEENAEEPEPGNLGQFTRNLAQCFLDEDDFDTALDLYENALHADRDDYGPAHRHVAADLIGMGKAFRGQSLFADAHRRFDEALAVYKRIQNGPAREQAQVWRQKGRAYIDAQDFERAVESLNEALLVTRMAEGPESPALGPEYVYLGRALVRLEQLPEAEKALKSALALHLKNAWMDEETLNAVYSRLGRVMKDQRLIDQAIVLFGEALEHDRKRFGGNHEYVAVAAYHLGSMHMAAYAYEEAQEHYETALAIYQNTRGPDHPRTRRVSQRIAMLENLV